MKRQKEGLTVSSARGEGAAPMGRRALHYGRTFDRDVDGVVHRAQLVPGGAAVISRV